MVGSILTSALVAGRIYGPTYYAQYGGNLQPAGNVYLSYEYETILAIKFSYLM